MEPAKALIQEYNILQSVKNTNSVLHFSNDLSFCICLKIYPSMFYLTMKEGLWLNATKTNDKNVKVVCLEHARFKGLECKSWKMTTAFLRNAE